jgi:multidrug resistance efflux pump
MNRKYLFLIGTGMTLIVIVFLASWGFGQSSAAPKTKGGYHPGEISANGLVEGKTPEIALRPEIVGTIRAITFREGQQVKKGDLLVELVNDTQKHQVAVSKAELEQAEAELDKVRNGDRDEKRKSLEALAAARKTTYEQMLKNWERAQKLLKTASIAREDFDAAEHQMKKAKAEWDSAAMDHALSVAPPRQDELDAAVAKVAAAKARWKLAEAELAKTQIRAPSDGCVLHVFAEPGDQAGPATSRPVLFFADLSQFRVRAFVEELDAPRVAVGQKVLVTVDGLPGQVFAGTVKLLLPRMGKRAPQSDQPGEYHDLYYREVIVELENGADLVVNLRITVRIVVDPTASS